MANREAVLSITEAGGGNNRGLATKVFTGVIGKFFSGFAKTFRWCPLGKRVRMTIAESLDGSMMGQTFSGVITKVVAVADTTEASLTEECPVIHLDSPVEYMNYHLERIVVVPRHTGYGLYSLPFTGIGVYVIPISGSEDSSVFNIEDAIAIWWLSLCRFRHSKAA